MGTTIHKCKAALFLVKKFRGEIQGVGVDEVLLWHKSAQPATIFPLLSRPRTLNTTSAPCSDAGSVIPRLARGVPARSCAAPNQASTARDSSPTSYPVSSEAFPVGT